MRRWPAVILAAGQGARFRAAGGAGASKLVAEIAGEPLVRIVARAALASKARPILVVTGHARCSVEAAVLGFEVACVHNPEFADGLSTSLKAGLAALPLDCDGAVILLADMPAVTSGTIDRLIAAAEAAPSADAVVPVTEGRRGNPVLLARSLFGRMPQVIGDSGARKLLDDPALEVVEIDAPPYAILGDVDLPGDLVRFDGR